MQYSKQEGGTMGGNELDASNFLYNDIIYTLEFEDILAKITSCFFKLKNDKKEVPLNDENGIRDILLLDYIRKEPKLSDFYFDRETSETISQGRIDIKVVPINPFVSYEVYYILECKRLDNKACRGSSGLNNKYIEDGIQRFTTGFYSSYFKINAMIGFVVDSINIDNNVRNINYLLGNNFKQIKTTSFLAKENFIEDFDFQYSSKHKTKDEEELKLYHLMFDFFSSN